jgi:hypothetical protein
MFQVNLSNARVPIELSKFYAPLRQREKWPNEFVTRLTRRVILVEQELPTLPEHLSSFPVFSGVCVTRSLVLFVCFVDCCLSFCAFSLGHCVFNLFDITK